jgi:alkanesulfonate monooxygenase SsuD/methylene tetrahydromethanopterin reductase-like flavin-dependent oxidoreductase (luciferase family)
VVEHSLIYGSPATVTEKLAEVAEIGVGGAILQFRLGPMSFDDVAQSLTLFMREVAPDLTSRARRLGKVSAPDRQV